MLDCREAFYGGAGGGGKSDALLMAALQYADVPGYSALIIRRNFSDLALPNALMDRAHAWLRGRRDAHWNENRKQWTFSSDATLTFGYLEGARDADRYASAEFHFIGVDEVTQFPEKQYLDLFARLRAPACLRCALEQEYIQHRELAHQRQTNDCPTCIDLERRQLELLFRTWRRRTFRCACVRRRIPAMSVMTGSSAGSSRGSVRRLASGSLCRHA